MVRLRRLLLAASTAVGCLAAVAPAAFAQGAGRDTTPIRIGGLFDKTGAAASYGQASLEGATLAIDTLNATGGINGRKIEFLEEDPGFNVGQATALLQRFANDEKVVAILGPNSETVGAATKDAVNRAQIVSIITAGGGSRPNSAYGQWSFSTAAPNKTAVAEVVRTLKRLGLKKVAVVYSTSRPFAVLAKDDFLANAAAEGLELAVEPQAIADNDLNFSALLTKLKAAGNVQAIFCSCLPNTAGPMINQSKQMGLGSRWISDVSLLDPSFYRLSQGAADGTLAATPFDPGRDTPAVRQFVESFKKKYNKEPSMFNATAYDSALALGAALRSIPGPLTRDAVRQAMGAVKVDGATGLVSFPDGAGQATRPGVFMVEMKGGQFVTFKP